MLCSLAVLLSNIVHGEKSVAFCEKQHINDSSDRLASEACLMAHLIPLGEWVPVFRGITERRPTSNAICRH